MADGGREFRLNSYEGIGDALPPEPAQTETQCTLFTPIPAASAKKQGRNRLPDAAL
jgi:hypothetical protein